MSGIYIHIPFCKKKCSYCNFFSVSSVKNKDAFLSSLIKEIDMRKNYLGNETVETVYFGGGTPSLLAIEEINLILGEIKKTFNLTEYPELTFEVNPESANLEYLKELRNAGVNRLSIGVQSFSDDDLVFLERIHSTVQAEKSVEDAIAAGFTNISIDLIYSIPVSKDNNLINNLEKIVDYGIEHFSAYSLTVENGTPLGKHIKNGIKKSIDEEMSLRQFELVMDFAANNSFEQYEISNFCKNGKYSKHNTSYWKGLNYLGLGPSAHSYNGNSRQWNTSSLNSYIEKINKEVIPCQSEFLTKEQKFNEYILISLRTIWGCDSELILNKFGEPFFEHFIKNAKKHISENRIRMNDGVFYLTRKGISLADRISSELFI